MGAYLIGQVIKQTRESLGISQEKLCEGICSVENLSRIENNKLSPKRTTFEALMERMSKSGKKYLPFVRHSDIEVHLMQEELHRHIAQHRYGEAEILLNKLVSKLDISDSVNRQYILRYQTLVDHHSGKINLSEKIKQLVDALRCTVPNYSNIHTLPIGDFSETELSIFCNIATSYAELGNLDLAINMLQQVLNYHKQIKTDIEEQSTFDIWILNNLSICQ